MNKKFFAALASATMAFTASGSIAVFADDFVEERNDIITGDDVKRRNIMNKKFFAALASATMAFTASGSIAVFADDFVEERNDIITGDDVKPVETTVKWNKENLASATMAFTASGSIAVFADDFVEERNDIITGDDVKPVETTVKWNKENFGDLVTVVNQKDTFTGLEVTLEKNKEVKTSELEKVTAINLQQYFEGEVKGLEYFPNLKTFDDTAVASTKKVTNAALDFSANTKLETLTVKNAEDLATLVLPEASKNEDDEDVYSLTTLALENTALTSLDLSAQTSLEDVAVKNNANLKDVKLLHGTKAHPTAYGNVDLSANSIETIDLANCAFHSLDLSGNHIGVIDFSQTTLGSKATLTGQTLYVSETLATVNLKDTFGDVDTHDFSATAGYNKKTGELDLEKAQAYSYVSKAKKGGVQKLEVTLKLANPMNRFATAGYNKKTGELDLEKAQAYSYVSKAKKGGVQKLEVTLKLANPMNRLYNPNSGEHFYTADIKEKDALVAIGWNDEGYGWVAPKKADSNKPVHRLYNPNAGDHHYTVSAAEKNTLVSYGWKYEGEGWKSAANTEIAVYRQYNPYANGAGSHNYTVDKAENDYLVSLGWTPEGKAWYGLK